MYTIDNVLSDIKSIPKSDDDWSYMFDDYDYIRRIAAFVYTVYPNNIQEVLNQFYPNRANMVINLLNNPEELMNIRDNAKFLNYHYKHLMQLINKYGYELVNEAVKQWHLNKKTVFNRIYRDYMMEIEKLDFGSDDGVDYFSTNIAYNTNDVSKFLNLTRQELMNPPVITPQIKAIRKEAIKQVNQLILEHSQEIYSIMNNIDEDDIRLIA